MLLTLVVLSLPRAASAAVIASEGFEAYTAGVTVVGAGTASNGWNGAWDQAGGGNPRATVSDTSGSPLSFSIPGGGSINGATRALEIQLTGAQTSQIAARRQLALPLTNTFYAGYLVRYVPGSPTATWAGANNTFTLHLADTSGNTSGSLNFGLRGGGSPKQDIMMRFGTGAPVAGAYITNSAIVTNQSYYLVCKIVWNGSAYTSAILWTNPPVNGEALLPGGNASLSGFSQGAVNYIFWREAVLDADDILQVDELKIGTTWEDVVPQTGSPSPQCSVETRADGTGVVVPAQTLAAGQSLTNYAIVRDAGGNFLSNSAAVWSLVNVTGGIVAGDLSPAGDNQSAIFTAPGVSGTAAIQAAVTGLTSVTSGMLRVSPPALPGIHVYDAVPGLSPSDKYLVQVCAATNTANWKSAFVWQTVCLTNSATDAYFSALSNWTHSYVNFEMTTPVVVEIARVGGGSISSAAVHPARQAAACVVTNGKAYITLNNPCNVAVDIDGKMDTQNTGYMKSGGRYAGPPIHTFSIHANPPLAGKPGTNDPSVYLVVPGTPPPTSGSWTTLYFLPGVHNIGLAYPLQANHQYYIPGDAIVYGTFYGTSGQGIRIFGHGTLSQTGWQNPKYVVPTPANFNTYHPIDISGALNTSVEGLTIADPAYHALMMYGSYNSTKYTLSSWVKIFGWRANGDGINPFGNGQIRNCFIRTQDDCSYVNGAGISETVFWNDANGSSFVLSALPNLTSRTLLINDCDVIYSRASWINWSGGRVFNMRGEGGGACGGGIIFSNINIEDPRPTMQQFFICNQSLSPYGSPTNYRGAGDLAGIKFINVSIAATNRNSEPEILWGNTNGQSSIHDLTFDNLTVGGVTILTNIFTTNGYVYNLRFTNSIPRWLTAVATTNDRISFSITNKGSYVGLPGANGASIFSVTNNGLWKVQATSNFPGGTWLPVATNTAPFTFTEPVTNEQRFYRVAPP